MVLQEQVQYILTHRFSTKTLKQLDFLNDNHRNHLFPKMLEYTSKKVFYEIVRYKSFKTTRASTATGLLP